MFVYNLCIFIVIILSRFLADQILRWNSFLLQRCLHLNISSCVEILIGYYWRSQCPLPLMIRRLLDGHLLLELGCDYLFDCCWFLMKSGVIVMVDDEGRKISLLLFSFFAACVNFQHFIWVVILWFLRSDCQSFSFGGEGNRACVWWYDVIQIQVLDIYRLLLHNHVCVFMRLFLSCIYFISLGEGVFHFLCVHIVHHHSRRQLRHRRGSFWNLYDLSTLSRFHLFEVAHL